MGDLIHGARDMAVFFVITVLLTTALLFGYSRCWRSTTATKGCCLLAVVWHLGVMRRLGFGLDPYSLLVPFLTFAIGAYASASTAARLQWALGETEGVQVTVSLFVAMKQVMAGSYGGNLKWATVTRNRFISNAAHKGVPQSFYNNDCSMLPVGIGVDYGIFLYNRLETYLERGLPLYEAYFETMKSTGLAVAFTGITLAAGVLTWVSSDIKFQADMGLLLTFMFVWNMLGAVIQIPALAALLRVRAPSAADVTR